MGLQVGNLNQDRKYSGWSDWVRFAQRGVAVIVGKKSLSGKALLCHFSLLVLLACEANDPDKLGPASADPCAVDNGGCGDPTYFACLGNSLGLSWCEDIDECKVNNGDCGLEAHATCINQIGGPPTCEDIDECKVNNGGCGDRTYIRCENNERAPPTCTDINECDTNNGGCGDLEFFQCQNNHGADPDCEDINECLTDNGGCGLETYTRCTNREGMSPICEDIDECLTDNGGCGDPVFYQCTNNAGALPTCTDIDECLTDNGGCGDPTYFRCINNEGALRTCEDINECLINNGGCPNTYGCTNNEGAAPTCHCDFGEQVWVSVVTDATGQDCSWDLVKRSADLANVETIFSVAEGFYEHDVDVEDQDYAHPLCLPPGCYDLYTYDSGWQGWVSITAFSVDSLGEILTEQNPRYSIGFSYFSIGGASCDDPCADGICDCSGVPGGLLVEDCYGDCGGWAVEDCLGVCNGNAFVDCYGVCGGYVKADCDGHCNGSNFSCVNCPDYTTMDCSGNCVPNGYFDMLIGDGQCHTEMGLYGEPGSYWWGYDFLSCPDFECEGGDCGMALLSNGTCGVP